MVCGKVWYSKGIKDFYAFIHFACFRISISLKLTDFDSDVHKSSSTEGN